MEREIRSELPSILPIIQSKYTILMPKTQMPIIMSEMEYLSVAPEIIENNILGVVQPIGFFASFFGSQISSSYKVGCAGRITDISQAEDDVIINVSGVCRFEIIHREPYVQTPERALVSYDKYQKADLADKELSSVDRRKLLNLLEPYFKNLDIAANWHELETTPVDALISALAMACPLHPVEKQSLLETVSLEDRSDMIAKMITINSFDRHHTTDSIN